MHVLRVTRRLRGLRRKRIDHNHVRPMAARPVWVDHHRSSGHIIHLWDNYSSSHSVCLLRQELVMPTPSPPPPVLSPCSAQPPVHTVLYVAILETCNFAMPSSCLIESLSAPEWLSWYQWHKRGVWQRFFVSSLATEQTTLKWSQLSFQHFIEILE